MGFRDTILDVPLINFVMGLESGGALLMELKELVVDSRERLLRFVRVLLKCYVSSVFVTASLYIVGAIYRMLVREDQSLRILGKCLLLLLSTYALLCLYGKIIMNIDKYLLSSVVCVRIHILCLLA